MPKPMISLSQIEAALACISLFLFFVSELLLANESTLSPIFKFVAFSLLGANLIIKPKVDIRRITLLAPILSIFALNFFISFSYSAAIDELLRFLFPITIIISLYKIKNLDSVAIFFIFLVITNNIYQVYAYFAYFTELPTLVKERIDIGFMLRAQGWVGYFSLFGFINFCALLLVSKTNIIQKNREILQILFFSFLIFSTSIKGIFGLFIYAAFFFNKKNLVITFSMATAIFYFWVTSENEVATEIYKLMDYKFSVYIFVGESARFDSYRVMLESLLSGNFTGEGLGSFGGPASTKFNSPLYDKYNFNWFGLDTLLTTTDTLYPHIFVELGLIGGFLYLYFLFNYGQQNKNKAWHVIALAFIADNLASFSLLSPPYFFSAAICLLTFGRSSDIKKTSTKNDKNLKSNKVKFRKLIFSEGK